MKDLKEKLFKEMDERMPEMSDRLNDYPITKKENKFLFSLNWKVLTPILSVILIALIYLPISFYGIPRGGFYVCYAFTKLPYMLRRDKITIFF